MLWISQWLLKVVTTDHWSQILFEKPILSEDTINAPAEAGGQSLSQWFGWVSLFPGLECLAYLPAVLYRHRPPSVPTLGWSETWDSIAKYSRAGVQMA